MTYIDMPLTPMRVWETIQAARVRRRAPVTEQGAELDEHGRGPPAPGLPPGEGGAA